MSHKTWKKCGECGKKTKTVHLCGNDMVCYQCLRKIKSSEGAWLEGRG